MIKMILKREMAILTQQMEQRSIISNVINYVQCNRNHKEDYYKLDIRALEPKNCKIIYGKLEEDDR